LNRGVYVTGEYGIRIEDTVLVNRLSCDTLTKRYEITDLSGAKIGVSDISHVDDVMERFYVYESACMGVSPDGLTLAVGTPYGAVLEIYSLCSRGIEQKYVGRYVKPSAEFATKGSDFIQTVLGFGDIFVSEDKIYSSYDGEIVGNRTSSDVFHRIAVWSTDGDAIKMVKTDKTVEKVCYDSSERSLYAVVSDDEGNYIAVFRGI